MIREDNSMPDVSSFIFYIDAYRELSTCRGLGSRIPFTAIVEYAKVYNIEHFEEFSTIIRRMETAQIESEKAKNGRKTS